MTRMLSPPRIGSGQLNTGRRTQSLLSPGACSVRDAVEAPDRRLGAVGHDLGLVRSGGVGFAPSIQMYSAWYATEVLSFPGSESMMGVASTKVCRPVRTTDFSLIART